MDDLLHAFLGYDGRHCRATRCEGPSGARVCYALEADADPSLAELVRRMLPIWCGVPFAVRTPCQHMQHAL